MKSVEAFLRQFAMDNILLVQDLKTLETEHKCSILEGTSDKAKDAPLYKEFEEVMRTEAREMAVHYEVFYCLERSIRKLIASQMELAQGITWWDSGKVPQVVVDEVRKRIQKEEESGMTRRSEEKLDYTTFGELGEIIKSNWVTFGAIFNNQRALEKILNSLNALRNNIAHCCPLAEDEKVRLRLTISDWFRLMS